MKKIIIHIFITLACITYSSVADPLGGTQYKLRSSVVGGGGRMTGGNYVLNGSVAQPNVGLTEGTGYSMKVGFWNTYLYKLIEYPTIQASNVTIANQTQIAWTRGDGERVAVFMKQANIGTATPVDNTTYTASTAFGSGTQIGTSAWFCIYDGTGTSVTVTGMSARTDYIVQAFEYKGAIGSQKFKQGTATNNPRSIQNQIITFDALASIFSDDADRALSATSSSNLDVTFSSSDEAVATVVNGKIHPVAEGTCSIYANQAGNDYYYSATQVSQPLTVQFAYFTDDESNKYATWTNAVSSVSNGTLTLHKNYVQEANTTISSNITLNLSGYNFTGDAISTIADGKKFSLNNSGANAIFDADISYAGSSSSFGILHSSILGTNFNIDAASASGIIEIGDGTSNVTYPFTIEDVRFNSKVSKVLVKNGAVLDISK